MQPHRTPPAHHPDSQLPHQALQRADNLHRILTLREHAAVRLADETYSFGLEPAQHVAGAETFQGAFHDLVPARIDPRKADDRLESVGDVAAATSGQRQLGHGLPAGLVDRQLRFRNPPLRLDREETARSPRSDYRDAHAIPATPGNRPPGRGRPGARRRPRGSGSA